MQPYAFIIGYLITGVVFGLITDHVAKSKGYDWGFGWGFWLGLIGLLVVGFRADKPKEDTRVCVPENYRGTAKINPAEGAVALEEQPQGNVITWIPSASDVIINGINEKEGWAKISFNGQEGYVKTDVLQYVAEDLTPTPHTSVSTEINPPMDFAETLQKLAKLHEQGILTDEEFQKKKTDILNRM